MRGWRAVSSGVALVAVLGTVCGGSGAGSGNAAGPGALSVVASFYPLAVAAEQVGGDRARVTNLTPTGAEPHDLELDPRQTKELLQAGVELPTTFFVDLDAFLGPLGLALDPPVLSVAGPAYAAARTALELRLDDGAGFTRPGETFFAFLVPERALEDQAVVEALVERAVLSSRLATCLLMVDFPNPVYSQRRASLSAYVPETIRGAGPGPASGDRGGRHHRARPRGRVPGLVAGKRRARLPRAGEPAAGRVPGRLPASPRRPGRRRRFRRSTLAGFGLTVPRSPDDDTYEALRLHDDGRVA